MLQRLAPLATTTALFGQIPKQVVETRRGGFVILSRRLFNAALSDRLMSAPPAQRLTHFLQTRSGLPRRERAILTAVI